MKCGESFEVSRERYVLLTMVLGNAVEDVYLSWETTWVEQVLMMSVRMRKNS